MARQSVENRVARERISGEFGAWFSAVGAVAGSEKRPEAKGGEMITGAQIKAARELLGWTPWKLARSSQVPSAVIRRAESVDGEPTITVYQEALIRNALLDAGVEFTKADEPGVKLRNSTKSRKGPQA